MSFLDIEMQHCPNWGAGELKIIAATCAAFAISRLRVRGGRTVMNLALFTYFTILDRSVIEKILIG